MRRFFYNRSVVVVDRVGTELGTAAEMPAADWEPFRVWMREVLEVLARTKTGADLLRALEATGRQVFIFSANTGGSNLDTSSRVYPITNGNMLDAMIRSFRPAQKNFSYTWKDDAETKQSSAKAARKDWEYTNPATRPAQPKPSITEQKRAKLLTQVTAHKLPTTRLEAAPELMAVLGRARAGQALTPRLSHAHYPDPMRQIPRLLGIGEDVFASMCEGGRGIKDDQYYQICFYLYDYLQPGPGTDAQVRVMARTNWATSLGDVLKKEKSIFRPQQDTERRVQAVIIGHELIHAWRCMAGRRVVSDGWEEEAMTTGIGPFAGWRLTENALRGELGLSVRMSYNQPCVSSDLFKTVRQMTNDGKKAPMRF